MAVKQRSVGVIMIGWVNIFYGFACLAWGVAVMPGIMRKAYPLPFPMWQHAMAALFGDGAGVAIVVLVGLLLIVAGFGLHLLRPWAHQFTLLGAAGLVSIQLLVLIRFIIALGSLSIFLVGYALPGLFWNIFTLRYLSRSGVKAQFQHK